MAPAALAVAGRWGRTACRTAGSMGTWLQERGRRPRGRTRALAAVRTQGVWAAEGDAGAVWAAQVVGVRLPPTAAVLELGAGGREAGARRPSPLGLHVRIWEHGNR